MAELFTDEWTDFPTGLKIMKCIATMSKRGGRPQAALAVDGCHVPITAPQENPEDFYNRKGSYSMNMQGLVNADGRFCNIQVNKPGRTHDAKA
jgi:hypothetical protein